MAVNRLTRVELPSGPMRREDYVLDANDNRIRVERRALPTDPTAASTDTYTLTAGTNRLASIALPTGTRSFTHGPRGNLTGESRPGGITVTPGYDAYARLTAYTRTGEASLAMVYNGLDQRVMLTRGGTTVRRFIQDADGRILGEYGANGSMVFAEYIWMLPEVGDAGTFGGDDGTNGWTPLMVAVANGSGGAATFHWLATSHLGTPVASNNSAGTATSLTTITLLGFPGQTQTLADLYYNQYRDYDPTTGRYIQADPIGLAGDANPYVYAGANPVGMVDPWGLRGSAALFPFISAALEYANQRASGRPNSCVNWGEVALAGVMEINPGQRALRALRLLGRFGERAAPTLRRFLRDERGSLGPGPRPGRLGGADHRNEVQRVSDDIESRGLSSAPEYHVRTPDGTKSSRFADLAAIDSNGRLVELHQIGRVRLRDGRPVSRERDAIEDINDAIGIEPTFHRYN